MALYDLTHTTHYRYSGFVSMCQNQLRLTPREAPFQHLLKHRLEIIPKPARIRASSDFFRNQVSYFELHQPHDHLQITMSAQIRVDRSGERSFDCRQPWEKIVQDIRLDRTADGIDRLQYSLESPLVPSSDDATELARGSFLPNRPILDALLDLNARIHTDFRYDTNATTIQTPLEEVFRIRRGVCQDLAHVFLAVVRSVGLAGRYVSGYLRTYPPKDPAALVGADASHAWVSIYTGELGWIDFDPTNNLVVANEHISLAWGRDFRDVTPINGMFVGAEQQSLDVAVQVKPILDSRF